MELWMSYHKIEFIDITNSNLFYAKITLNQIKHITDTKLNYTFH